LGAAFHGRPRPAPGASGFWKRLSPIAGESKSGFYKSLPGGLKKKQETREKQRSRFECQKVDPKPPILNPTNKFNIL
jgi:hypothetical protein